MKQQEEKILSNLGDDIAGIWVLGLVPVTIFLSQSESVWVRKAEDDAEVYFRFGKFGLYP